MRRSRPTYKSTWSSSSWNLWSQPALRCSSATRGTSHDPTPSTSSSRGTRQHQLSARTFVSNRGEYTRGRGEQGGGGTALVIDVHSRRRPKERCSSYMSLLQHCYIVKFSFSIRSFARHFAAPSPKCREPLLHHPLARFFAAAQPSFGKRVDHTLCVRSLDLPLAPGREGSLASSPTREARRGIGDHSANWATHSDMG